MRRVIILGASGTIGQSTLQVCLRYPDLLQVVGVQVHNCIDKLVQIHTNFPHARLVASASCDTNITQLELYAYGPEAIKRLIFETEADIVLNGIAGSAGYYASFWTLESGKNLAIANKESLVMAGGLLLSMAQDKGLCILPVDSEHWALFSLMKYADTTQVAELVLTASGGPFHHYTADQLVHITPEQAVRHPTWSMGPKISIDSATLANKGLEVIEAWHLFGLPVQQIKVVVHRQSLIHAMLRMQDGALYTHVSKPDMQLPIQDALLHPVLKPVPTSYLDLAQQWQFSLEPVSHTLKPMLDLAYQSCEEGGINPIIYNAANEAAVQLFRDGRIGFLDIPICVEKALARNYQGNNKDRDGIFYLHQQCYDTVISHV